SPPNRWRLRIRSAVPVVRALDLRTFETIRRAYERADQRVRRHARHGETVSRREVDAHCRRVLSLWRCGVSLPVLGDKKVVFEQAPQFELMESFVDTGRSGDDGAGLTHLFLCSNLRGR